MKPVQSITFLGDSITLGYGLSHPSDRFSTKLCESLRVQEINLGITGTLIATAGVSRGRALSFVERMEQLREADFAIVFGGTNDYFWSDRPIDPPATEGDNTDYFAVAAHRLCQFCAEVLSPERTLIVTPYFHRGVGNYLGGECWNAHTEHNTDTPNFNGHVLADYVACLETAAERWQLPVLNLHKASDFDWKRYTLDGCHPNAEGHAWLAKQIQAKL